MTERDLDRHPRRFGRPPKPAELVRSERVVSFVTPGELEQLEKISNRRGVSLSAVIHSMVVRSLEGSRRGNRTKGINVPQRRKK